jgi:hypothetical protein
MVCALRSLYETGDLKMTGKPNIPHNYNSAMTPPSLINPLDQERAASMADEGGASGAFMETQEKDVLKPGLALLHPFPGTYPSGANGKSVGQNGRGGSRSWAWIAGGALVAVAAGSALILAYRRRGEPALQPE